VAGRATLGETGEIDDRKSTSEEGDNMSVSLPEIKALLLKSGNRCAFPGCGAVLFQSGDAIESAVIEAKLHILWLKALMVHAANIPSHGKNETRKVISFFM